MSAYIPDDLITLTEAAKRLPGRTPGRRLGVATLHRWAGRGVRGVKLRTTLVGGHRMTTEAWLAEFLAALNGRPAANPDAAAAAAAELIAMGA